MKFAFVFPGQGAQYVGMGKGLRDAYSVVRETFEEADDALGFSISKVILEGPEDELRLTYNTQPALLTVSIAALRAFRTHTDVIPEFVAGHSLGEYSALVAADALGFGDAVKLVHWRGRLMDEAVPAGVGAMAAVLGLESASLDDVCKASTQGDDLVELANINCPGQIVISGTASAVSRASTAAKEAGAKRVIPLTVSGPFHCSLMKPAADNLMSALADVTMTDAKIPVMANVDAKPRVTVQSIRQALVEQLYSPVRWQEDVQSMTANGVDAFIEFGPGTVLTGLIKKVDRGIRAFHVEDEQTLAETLKAIEV